MVYQNYKTIYYWEFQYNGVSLYVVSSDKGVVNVKIGFAKERKFMTRPDTFVGQAEFYRDKSHNEDLIDILKNYLKGRNPSLDFAWDIRVSPFMYNVYKNACTIPYGETKTYKDIADMVDTPKGARAVGQALKKNPLCILIPCHRVVAMNGLGGFSSGIDLKRYLLDLEQGQKRDWREN